MPRPRPASPRPCRPRGRALVAGAVVGVMGCVIVLVGGCSSGASAPRAPSAPGGPSAGRPAKVLHIVAAENFWGSIVAQLAGRAGQVTSIVTDPNADPHNYESSSSDARAVADADYVVVNGAGYDAWAQQLIGANPNASRKILTVANLLGQKDGANPHFWYNPSDVTRVADQMTADLKGLDPADAGYFDSRRTAFDTARAPYFALLSAITSAFAGTPVASTESIFVYLADDLGLKVLSPPAFMNAVAEGNDPPAPSVAAFQNLLATRAVRVFVFNEQTSTVVTTNLRRMATQWGIPIVGVTETIQPANASFEDWMVSELTDLQGALARAAATG